MKPGNYVMLVNRVREFKSNRNIEHTVVAVELEVVEVIGAPADSSHALGDVASWVIKIKGAADDNKDYFVGLIKDFLCVAWTAKARAGNPDAPECLESDVDEELFNHTTGEDNPLAGTYLKVSAFDDESKAGKTITRVSWGVPDDLERFVRAA